jgi:hypothetical protein
MSVGAQITAATDRAKERRAAAVAKKAKRKDVRATRKEHGAQKRTAAKAIRQGELKGKARQSALGANRVFHKVDKEGKPGGFTAFGKYTAKVGAKNKKREERKTARADRKTARTAKRAESKTAHTTRKAQRDAWKDKKNSVSKTDRSFHTMAAKQKQMKEWEYYDKYVK